MPKLDEAHVVIKNILHDAEVIVDQINTEEDTKFQLISRILVDVLGWDHKDFRLETKHDNGFSDYLLFDHDAPTLLIEAKRLSSLKIETSKNDVVRHLKIAGPALENVIIGIEQAASYAMPNGLPVAVLTDGQAWIIFKTFFQGENYKQKQAIVFPSFQSIVNDFSLFFELLSKDFFTQKQYNPIFDKINNKRVLLSTPLTAPFAADAINITPKSEMAHDLDQVFKVFFDRMKGDDDPDLLIECFVETQESRIADFSLEKMTAKILGNLSPKDRDINDELSHLIADAIEVIEDGQTVFIVGPTGSGKTTFLDRFFRKTLSPSLRGQCLDIWVNNLDATGNHENALSWLTEQIISSIEAHNYEDSSPTYSELRGLYYTEYNRRKVGPGAALYGRDKQAFREQFGDYLHKKVSKDREGYLHRLLTDAVHNRKKLPVIIIDNTDEFSKEYKTEIFQFAQSLRRHVKHCLLIFPVTDKSAWSFSKTDIYSIYQSKSFFLPTPSPREVFRKRIEFIERRLSSEKGEESCRQYFSKKGIKISISDMSGFAKSLESIFVEQDYTSQTIGELSNYNIRRTLELSKRIITSPVLNVDDLIISYTSGTFPAPNLAKFMNALLKGDYAFYKRVDAHHIFPIFQVSSEIAQSPLIFIRILTLLEQVDASGKDIDDRHISSQSIFDYFDSTGCTEEAIDSSILELLESGLIEPYDASMKALSPGQKLAITHSGKAHLRLARNNSIFFEQMALTTSITNEETAHQIRHAYKSETNFDVRMRNVRKLFFEFLNQEDRQYLAIPEALDQYKSQLSILPRLQNIAGHIPSASCGESSSLGPDFCEGIIEDSVHAVVDWFDPSKGFGFVKTSEIPQGIFLHLSKLQQSGIETVTDGDELLVEVTQTRKGIQVSKVHELKTDISALIETACEVIRLFPDRSYGFAKRLDGKGDVFFHYRMFSDEERYRLTTGLVFDAQVKLNKHGDGYEVYNALSKMRFL